MEQNSNKKSNRFEEFLISPLGCGTIFFIILLIIMIITVTIKKNKYANEPWYIEMEAENKHREDSIKRLNELAKTNPEEYNRIIYQSKLWQYTPKEGAKTQNDVVSATILSLNSGAITLPPPIKRNKKAPRFISLGKSEIIVKYNKQGWSEVIIRIINIAKHHNSQQRYLIVVFDKGKSSSYSYNLLGNNTIELINNTDFIEHCKTAKHIKFSIPVIGYTQSQTDNVEYSFEVPEPLVLK